MLPYLEKRWIKDLSEKDKSRVWQKYHDREFIAVRYPFVIGRDDYTDKAQALGFCFSKVQDWIYDLLDDYIDCLTEL